jgi:hypothetical protein
MSAGQSLVGESGPHRPGRARALVDAVQVEHGGHARYKAIPVLKLGLP